MTRLALIGATGNLGRHVAAQALDRGWELAVAVRDPQRLSPEVASRARIARLDLGTATRDELTRFVSGHDAFVFCAGVVTEGQRFVSFVDAVVSALEQAPPDRRPVCWFLAGAALLPLDARGRCGVDLPRVRDTYWPHRANHERLRRSALDWRLLCPGPMVEKPALGVERLRISVDALPAPLAPIAGALPAPLLLPLFAMKVPEMIVPYADAASVMLANVAPAGPMSRRRVGLALPAGMRGRKDQWAARPRTQA